MKIWLLFALAAAIFWGAYVPTIFFGQQAFGTSNPNRSMRAFLFIGLAYFVMAILVPGLWLATHRDAADTGFTVSGATLSTLAGILGAAGALSVVFALRAAAPAFKGAPSFIICVAPIVFAGAPIVNVIISYIIDFIKGQAVAPHYMFIVGLLVAVLGVTLVLIYNPAAHAAKPSASTAPATAPATGPALQQPAETQAR